MGKIEIPPKILIYIAKEVIVNGPVMHCRTIWQCQVSDQYGLGTCGFKAIFIASNVSGVAK